MGKNLLVNATSAQCAAGRPDGIFPRTNGDRHHEPTHPRRAGSAQSFAIPAAPRPAGAGRHPGLRRRHAIAGPAQCLGLARQAGQAGGGLCGGRRHGRDCAPGGRQARRPAGPARGGGQPRRRQQQRGRRGRGARAGRWLHAIRLHHRQHHQRHAVPQAGLRPGQGLRAHRHDRQDSEHPGGQPQAAHQEPGRLRALRQGVQGRHHVCVLGQRLVHPPLGRDVQDAVQAQDAACALPGQRTRRHRPAGRPGGFDVRQHAVGPAACAGGQAARHCHHQRPALAPAAGRAHAGRVGLHGL